MKTSFSSVLPLVAAAAALCVFASSASAEVTASADAGAKKAAMCIGCHSIPGYQASFPEVHRVPMISGQSGKYIAASLAAYQKGERKHPTMRAVAVSLSEQDMADLAAFYEKQGPGAPAETKLPEPSTQVAGLLAKGACVTCHGANFNKPIDVYPKLAGQHADYLYVALKSYQTTHNPQIGRANATMAAQVQNFNHAELKALAEYLATVPGELRVVPQSRFR